MPATARTSSSCGSTGATYEEIARAGGGIVSTVKATRAAERGRAGRRHAAAARRADRRGRDHGRDQVRLRAGPRRPSAGCCARRAALGRAAAGRGRARPSSAPTRCRPRPTATRTPTSTGSRARCCRPSPPRAWPTRSTPSARASPSRRSRPRASSRPPGALGLPVQAARRPALEPRRRGAGGELRRALGRPPRTHRRGRRRGDGRGRHGRGAAARRVLLPARDAGPAGRGLPPARRADRHRDRLQPRHLAAHLAAAGDEHGRDAVPPDRRRVPGRRHARGGPRARAGWTRSARWSRASGATSRSGTSSARPSCVYRIGLQPAARAGLEGR